MIQGATSSDDKLFGGFVLAIFLVFVFALGWAIVRFKNARFRRAWGPLVPLFTNARIIEDQGGAATSWISGQYQGRLLTASMTPNISRNSDSALGGNRFSIIVSDVEGKHNWSVGFSSGIPLIGTPGWNVRAEDRTTEARLAQSGILALLDKHGSATVRYNARDQQMTWEALIEPYWVLPPEHFASTVDTLISVAKLGTAANS